MSKMLFGPKIFNLNHQSHKLFIFPPIQWKLKKNCLILEADKTFLLPKRITFPFSADKLGHIIDNAFFLILSHTFSSILQKLLN